MEIWVINSRVAYPRFGTIWNRWVADTVALNFTNKYPPHAHECTSQEEEYGILCR